MLIPSNIIANADDLGLNRSINRAILFCFRHGYINSTSLLTNMEIYDETVDLIRSNPSIHNIGVHINFAEGRPVTNFSERQFLDENGNWDLAEVGKKKKILSRECNYAFFKEITAQIDRALADNIPVNHLDSHYHLHALPYFYRLFIIAAKQYKLKLRLAQTYYEGNVFNYAYRKLVNNAIISNRINYSYYFEDIHQFVKDRKLKSKNNTIEIMLHPDFDGEGNLIDHFDYEALSKWTAYLKPAAKKNSLAAVAVNEM